MTYYHVDGPDGNLLTPEILTNMREYERSFYDLKDWDKFCLVSFTAPGECSFTQLESITNALFPTIINTTVIPNGEGELVANPEQYIRDNFDVADITGSLSNNFLDGGNAYVALGGLNFGYPLEGYDKPFNEKQQEEMNELFNAFAIDIYNKLIEDNLPENVEARGFEVYYIGVGAADGVTNLEFFAIITADGLKALGSVAFVLVYMYFHTRTLSLSCLGMFHILSALPLALFVNRVIIGIQFINFLQFLSVYIILGIGADDVFIMLDAWKQAALEAPHISGNVTARMSWAVARAAKAMAISSATTAAAFYVNGFSTIPSVAFFGIFTGSLVVSNYILVITWFPAAIIMKERVSRYGCLSLCGSRTARKSRVTPDGAEAGAQKRGSHDVSEVKLRRLEGFFRDSFTPFMYKNRVPIIAAFFVLVATTIILALQIEPASDPGRFLPDDANLQRFIDSTTEAFPTAIPATEALFLWGVTGIDREGVDPTDLSFLGVEQYYENWNPASVEAQDFLVEACELLKGQDEWVRSTVTGTGSNTTSTPEVGCFIEDLYEFLNESNTYRIPEVDFYDVVDNYTQEIAAELALVDSPSGDSRPTSWLGFDKETKEIVWVAMVANISLDNPFAPAQTIRPVFDLVEAFRGELSELAGNNDIGPVLQTAGGTWIQMATEEVLLTVAFSGAIISLIATFVVMLISTQVVLIAFYVVLTVGLVFIALVAAMVAFGWTIGVIESISLTVTVGLAVDYVVHLANSYNESSLLTRFLRLQQGMTEMGISVFSSAITTLGSALVLLTTSLVFFSRFGTFIAVVITLSFIYAFGFFVALAAIGGPLKNTWFAGALPFDLSGNDQQFPEHAGSSGVIWWNGKNGSTYDPRRGTVTSADGRVDFVDPYGTPAADEKN